MNDDQRDAIRAANQRRNISCRTCGGPGITIQDGSKCGGMPGLNYKVCGNCGAAHAITKRQTREKLR